MFTGNSKQIYDIKISHPKSGVWFAKFYSLTDLGSGVITIKDSTYNNVYLGTVIKLNKTFSKFNYTISGFVDNSTVSPKQFYKLPVATIAQSLIPGKSLITSTKPLSFITLKDTVISNLFYLANNINESIHINSLGMVMFESQLLTEMNLDTKQKLSIGYNYIDIPLTNVSVFPSNIERLEITERGIRLWI